MRHSIALSGYTVLALMVLWMGHPAGAQESTSSLIPKPTLVSVHDSSDLPKYDKKLIQLPAVKVAHADTAQVFMFGDKDHPVHVVIPAPAIDAAQVGDMVQVTGIVRRYNPNEFEQDYRWFHEADYQDVHSGDWVIVASSVQTSEGVQLVPGSTVSTIPPNAPKTKPEDKH